MNDPIKIQNTKIRKGDLVIDWFGPFEDRRFTHRRMLLLTDPQIARRLGRSDLLEVVVMNRFGVVQCICIDRFGYSWFYR